MQTSAHQPHWPKLVHLVGPQGSGKTTIAAEIVATDARAGMRTISVTSEEFRQIHSGSVDHMLLIYGELDKIVLEHQDSLPIGQRFGDEVIEVAVVVR